MKPVASSTRLIIFLFSLLLVNCSKQGNPQAPVTGAIKAAVVSAAQKELWFSDFLQTDNGSVRGGYVEIYAYCPINQPDSWVCRDCMVNGQNAGNDCSKYQSVLIGNAPACPQLSQAKDPQYKTWGCFYGLTDNTAKMGMYHPAGTSLTYGSKGYTPASTLEVYFYDDKFVYDLSEVVPHPGHGNFHSFGQTGNMVDYPMRGQLWAMNHQFVTQNAAVAGRYDAPLVSANSNYVRLYQSNMPNGSMTNFLAGFPAGSKNVVQGSYYPSYDLSVTQNTTVAGLASFGNLKQRPVDLYQIRDSVIAPNGSAQMSELYTYGRTPDAVHHFGMVGYAGQFSAPVILANPDYYPGAPIDATLGLVQLWTKWYTQVDFNTPVNNAVLASNQQTWWSSVLAAKPLNDHKLRARSLANTDDVSLPFNRGGFSPYGSAKDFANTFLTSGSWMFAEHNLADSDYYFEFSGQNPKLVCNQGYRFRGSLLVKNGFSGISRKTTGAGWMGLCVASHDSDVYLGGPAPDAGFSTRGFVYSAKEAYVCNSAGVCRAQAANNYVNLFVRNSQCVGTCNSF